jgi:hypothetical protein
MEIHSMSDFVKNANANCGMWVTHLNNRKIGFKPHFAGDLDGNGNSCEDGGKDREGANEGMQTPESYVNERLDHLGVVAGVCEEIGLAAYLDRLAGETNRHVSMGTATVAMILNGLGFSNRRLYLVPQFFANKPVEHLLGPGIEAADLNDDCLDRTLGNGTSRQR